MFNASLKKLVLITYLALFSLTPAQADSAVNPCLPTRKMMPSRMTCNEGNLNYSIVFETLASSSYEKCPGNLYREVTTTDIEIGIKVPTEEGLFSTIPQATIHLEAETFEKGTTSPSNGYFKSDLLSLDLKNCIIPMHGGGMSAGN